MDILYEFHDNLIRNVNNTFFRFLFEKIRWEQRMLAVKGPRGSGKTTLMLQYLKYQLQLPPEQALYVTADHYWFYTHNLVETADEFQKNGGKHLFVDEVHKYPRWSRELKNIYDGYPGLQVVFSSSSALDIYRGEADLSRRVITYELPGLSFREFLEMSGQGTFPIFRWEDIMVDASTQASMVTNRIKPLPWFKKYLQYGYLPLFLEGHPDEVPLRLNQVVNTVVDTDLNAIEGYGPGTAFKLKKLLGILADSVPFKPNIAALARKLEVGRESVYSWLSHLEKARLLNLLMAEGKGLSLLQKPEKIFLENTNLAYAMIPNPEVGNIRETFLLNQLRNAGIRATAPKRGDFLANNMHIEVGGKNKSSKQVSDQAQFRIASDGIESAYGSKLPLWMFGFLY